MILRTLNRPKRAKVILGRGEPGGCAPLAVDGSKVELVRETWLLEDAWWTERPLRRRYWELVSESGRSVVVFHDLCSGRWFTQVG
jgi:hypothetical protein